MNALLEQTKKALLDKADPRLRKPILATVDAGRKVMYSPQSRGMVIEQLKQSHDPEGVGAGVAKLIGILYKQAPRGIPMQVAIPAAFLLMCEALQLLEDAGAAKIDQQFLSACTSATGSSVLQIFGAKPEQLQAFISKGGQPAAPQPQQPQPQAPQPAGVVGAAMGGA